MTHNLHGVVYTILLRYSMWLYVVGNALRYLRNASRGKVLIPGDVLQSIMCNVIYAVYA